MIKKTSSEQQAYMAGFIDADGCFQIIKRKHTREQYIWIGYSIILNVTNTNKEVIDYIHDIFGVSSKVYCQKFVEKRKDVYRLCIGGRQAQEITKLVLPYLIVKKERAKIFLSFPLKRTKVKREEKEIIFQQMRKLNHIGKS